MKLNKSVDDRKLYLYYKIGTFGAILNDAVIITLNILNEYFDSDSPISLGKYNLKYIHKCTNIIINKMKVKGLTIKNTRKKH